MNSSTFHLTVWGSRFGRFLRSTRPLRLQSRSSALTLWHSGTTNHPKYSWSLSPNAATFATKKKKTKNDPVALGTKAMNLVSEPKTTTPESNAWETMQLWKEEIVLPRYSSDFDKKIPKLFKKSNITTVQHLKDKSIDGDWCVQLGKYGVMERVLLAKLKTVFLETKTTGLLDAAKTTFPVSTIVTPESNAWDAMQLWKNEIVTPGGDEHFDEKVPKLLAKSNITTVQHLKDRLTDADWCIKLGKCGVIERVLLFELSKVSFPTSNPRMVPVDYQITNTTLSHSADLEALRQRVNETFGWYTKPGVTPEFVAPYFPIIQSSGMGKTKLLYELRKVLNDDSDTFCQLCLPGKVEIIPGFEKLKESVDGVYFPVLNLDKIIDQYRRISVDDAPIVAEAVMNELDSNFPRPSAPKTRLVILFDEAQILLKEHFGYNAFLFQCVRLWLRQVREGFKFVAVFSGTSSTLSNFYPDSSFVNHFLTRHSKRNFLERGELLPLPFYQTTTIGCLTTIKSSKVSSSVACTEYDQAIPYGRPLFAKMAEEDLLEKRLGNVLSRMLLLSRGEQHNYTITANACLSILATRVQMGQTSTKTASDLVAKGYANLVHFTDDHVAKIFCFTDPVCARLAMAMMDESWSLDVEGAEIKGKPKSWWVQKTFDAFSGGLCVPDKGNTGEIFVAMYLLFCGDLLRKKIDPSYKTFSVPLDSWVENLINPPSETSQESDGQQIATVELVNEPSNLGNLDSIPTVSFIQVCRNYLRPYRHDYSFVTCQSLLEDMYKSGTAFYTVHDCPHFDIVASIRYFHEDKYCYAPLLISVKSCLDFTYKEAENNCKQMEDKLKETQCHRALCLVVLIGSDRVSDYEGMMLKKEDIYELFGSSNDNEVKARVLKKGDEDSFGISSMMLEATSVGEQISEIFTSHHFIRSHAKNVSNTPLPVDKFLRSNRTKKSIDFFQQLETQLKSETNEPL